MQDNKIDASGSLEVDLPLHKVFVDLSLENDLREDELEWFRSKMILHRVDGKQKKTKTECQKIQILTEHGLEKGFEKPNKVLLKLNETETIWLFSLTSYCEDEPDNVEKIIRENQTYQMKKTKKEIIRKRCTGDVQTPCRIVKSTGVLTTEIITQDAAVLASEWDLYDIYKTLGQSETVSSAKYMKLTEPAKSATLNLQQKMQSLVLISDDLEPTLFTYAIGTLWSFRKELETPLAVTGMDWNPSNQDLLAVAYGDLSFDKESLGLVCIWSSKNPRQPEKQFHLQDSVTSLHFSRMRPNTLAAATRKGNVYVLDVSSEKGKLRLLKSSDSRPGPIWKVEWFLHEELIFKNEELLTVGEGGELRIFSTSFDKKPKDILKLEYVTSTRKFPEKLHKKKIYRHKPVFYETFDKKTFSGLCFSICSGKNFCYISTKEGVVLKCNLRNPFMTDGMFLAHDGPAYVVQHSPVTDLVYLTCGADWSVKIWMEGISQPLITLQHKAPVTCARWSPTIPTLIASVTEKELSLWDIARNVLSPMSARNFLECRTICNLLFSSNGANVVIGSEDGLVHVLHLSELPRIPFLQKEALIAAIGRILLRDKGELYVKFCKTVQANKDELKTQVLDRL